MNVSILTKQTSKRFPPWIRTTLKTERDFSRIHSLVHSSGLHTVCEEARCPNRRECWNSGTATVMMFGEICTRSCRFCSVKTGDPKGAMDWDEPKRVARAVKRMKLKYLIITCVTRDDLSDGGASMFAQAITEIKNRVRNCIVEVLASDLEGKTESLQILLKAEPDVFGHNVETVRRLQKKIRHKAYYDRSLNVLKQAATWKKELKVKSGLMVGLGETDEEVLETISDLGEAGCTFLTVGQYLRPSFRNLEVQRYVEPEQFKMYETEAKKMGFEAIASGPMVRSSYRADELYKTACGA